MWHSENPRLSCGILANSRSLHAGIGKFALLKGRTQALQLAVCIGAQGNLSGERRGMR